MLFVLTIIVCEFLASAVADWCAGVCPTLTRDMIICSQQLAAARHEIAKLEQAKLELPPASHDHGELLGFRSFKAAVQWGIYTRAVYFSCHSCSPITTVFCAVVTGGWRGVLVAVNRALGLDDAFGQHFYGMCL